MNKRYITGFLGMIMALVCVIGMTGVVLALPPIDGKYDPMNPLEFVLACCQWEVLKKMELTVLGMAPDSRYYIPELAALDNIPSGRGAGAGLGQIGAAQVQSYGATTGSCCGERELALIQAQMDMDFMSARHQAWQASQAEVLSGDQASIDNGQVLSLLSEETNNAGDFIDYEQVLSVLSAEADDDSINNKQVISVLSAEADDTDENVDEAPCAACAEAQMFAEWIFSQPKAIAE